MKKRVRVINKTGMPNDTQVIVDGKKLPLSNMMSVNIIIDPSDGVIANVRLLVDELDVLENVVSKES